MKALRYIHGKTKIVELPEPEVAVGETLVRVECVGVCRTDVYVARGAYPSADVVTLGHEFCGVVEHSDRIPAGTRVSANPFLACRECDACAAGQRCVKRGMIGVDVDGAFAELVVVPTDNLVPSGSSDPRRVAYIEPIAAALAPLKVAAIREGRGAVFGTGRIADLTAMVLRDAGIHNFSVGRPDEGTFDWVIETSAGRDSLNAAIARVRRGGTFVLKSRPAYPEPFDIRRAVENELTIRAVHYGDFQYAAELSTRLELEPLFGEIVPLESYRAVFENADDESRKVFLGLS